MKQRPKLLDTGAPKVYHIDIEFANQRAKIILPSRDLAETQVNQIRATGVYLGSWITNIVIEERDAVGNEFA